MSKKDPKSAYKSAFETVPSKKAKRAVKPTETLVKAVNQIINKRLETKKACFESGTVSFNSGIDNAGDCQQVMPAIALGPASYERNGQSITLMKIVIQGSIVVSATSTTDVSNFRYLVRHLLLRSKERNDWADVLGVDLANLLEAPGTSGQYFTGALVRAMTPVNRESFTVKQDKKYWMGCAVDNGAAASQNIYAVPTNNVKFFKFVLKFGTKGRTINYQGGSTAIDFPYFMTLGYAHLNNGGADAVATDVAMQYSATAYYKDA